MSNINPNYIINPTLFAFLVNHSESMRGRYSKLLAFRMDFFYLKGSQRFNDRTNDYSCCDMYRLAEWSLYFADIIGYSWVMEHTQTHGTHFHAMFYINGQQHQNYFPFSQELTQQWQVITRYQGSSHDCNRSLANYPVNGQGQFHYANDKRQAELEYAISYMAKEEQKERGFEYGLSHILPPSGRGRPRVY